jgi:hypothetical protein
MDALSEQNTVPKLNVDDVHSRVVPPTFKSLPDCR